MEKTPLQCVTEAYFRAARRSHQPGPRGDLAANLLWQMKDAGRSPRLRRAAETALDTVGALVRHLVAVSETAEIVDVEVVVEVDYGADADADADAAPRAEHLWPPTAADAAANDHDRAGGKIVTFRRRARFALHSRMGGTAAACAVALLAASLSLSLVDPGRSDTIFDSLYSFVDEVPGFGPAPAMWQ